VQIYVVTLTKIFLKRKNWQITKIQVV